MNNNSNGRIWLNACIAIGMCLCTFLGALRVDFSSIGYDIAFPTANIIFAFMTFPATDILTEVYGKRAANTAVWIGYVSQATSILVIRSALLLPGDTSVLEPFAQSGVVVFLASTIAYLLAQYWDVLAFHYIKEKVTGSPHLWLRNNLSTISSQFINSAIFISIVFSTEQFLPLLAGSMMVKCCAAVIDTPFVYLGCYLLRHNQPSGPTGYSNSPPQTALHS